MYLRILSSFLWYLATKYYGKISSKINEARENIRWNIQNWEWDEFYDELKICLVIGAILIQILLGMLGICSFFEPLNDDLVAQICRIALYSWTIWIFVFLKIEWENYKDHLRRLAEEI